MYTVEFEKDASIVTSLDETDRFEDVEMVIGEDDTVYLRQFEPNLNEHQIIYISYQQLLDLVTSLNSTEGAFYAKLRGGTLHDI
jgi:hypothetical protein|tara:strand:- start:305 stop:556 length:252 start_codon:yes stop_codon:yes gene_type:complete